MCIIFFIACDGAAGEGEPLLSSSSLSPGFKLVLASNRDEVYTRPALPASIWSEAEHVIAGKDLEEGKEGGAWLGVSAKDNHIKVGALLNIPGEEKPADFAGRGPIVADYLKGDLNNFDYADSLFRKHEQYNAFNFVSIHFNEDNKFYQILHASNAPREIKDFPSNVVHGFSNSPWRQPLKKVDHGKRLFSEVLAKSPSKDALVSGLLNLLKNDDKFPDDEELLRRVGPRAAGLSSVHVDLPDVKYGSRTRTIILIDKENNLDFFEETRMPDGSWKNSHIQKKLL